MKTQFICVIFVIFASVVLANNADYRQSMQDCMSENNVSEAEIREMMAGGVNTDAKDTVKCYSKCMMEKLGHFSNGAFDPQAAIETLKNGPPFRDHGDEVAPAVQACKDIKGSNDCDTSFKIFMCLKEHKTAH